MDEQASGGSAGGARWARVRLLFERAVDLPPAERGAMLERECGEDAALRREIEAVLEAAERDDRFLTPPAASPSPGPDARRVRSSAHPSIGRFVVVRALDEGRTGRVHLSTDERDGREVALRVVPLDAPTARANTEPLENPDVAPLQRLRTEAKILARLEHPGIARVLELGVCARLEAPELPAIYFANEYVPRALPLLAFAERHGLDRRGKIELLRAACAAVAQAHERGAIHGALNARNVLVDAQGRVRIFDFGVARVFPERLPPGQEASAWSDLASLGTLLGGIFEAPSDDPMARRALEIARRAAERGYSTVSELDSELATELDGARE